MSKRLDENSKQKLKKAFKEVTGRDFHEVVPEREKREKYILEFRRLLRCGKYSPDTAINQIKKFIIDFRVAKKAVQAMYLLKNGVTIDSVIKDADKRIEMYEFYIKNGLEKTIEEYFS